jgi:hypothetical protein
LCRNRKILALFSSFGSYFQNLRITHRQI